jgi:hypothetical protein
MTFGNKTSIIIIVRCSATKALGNVGKERFQTFGNYLVVLFEVDIPV